MAMSVPEPQLLLWTAAPDFAGGMIILQQQALVVICPGTVTWCSNGITPSLAGPCYFLLLHADIACCPCKLTAHVFPC